MSEPGEPLRLLGDRVLIRPDREEFAPTRRDSGILTAKTLEAAVEGSDPMDSWFTGTIAQVGPLVQVYDVRDYVIRQLKALDEFKVVSHVELCGLRHAVEDLPRDCPDPLQVGDRVCFSAQAGYRVTMGGEPLLVLHASEVLAILNDEVTAQAAPVGVHQ